MSKVSNRGNTSHIKPFALQGSRVLKKCRSNFSSGTFLMIKITGRFYVIYIYVGNAVFAGAKNLPPFDKAP
jgi:hypothetical protein